MNTLYYGDNLDVLRRYVKDDSVDLVYLDPPFKSNQDYNVLFREKGGTPSAAQIKAFEDTWRWDEAAAAAYEEVVESGDRVSQAMQAFRTFLGESDMLAYLSMMAPRIVELRRVLKATGSIYLHCDPAASHYLKMLMDAILGASNFRNEIIWKRTTAHSSAKRFAPIHDTIFYYGRADTPTWNEARVDYEQEYLDKYYRFDDGDGRLYWRADLTGAGIRHGRSGLPWRGFNPASIGRHWIVPIEELDALDAQGRIYWPKGGKGMPQHKRYREDLKGKAVPDLWDDIDRINPVGAERLGYPTQKPEALLERIIRASSNEGGVVLDPFCGCGTTIAASQQLKRQWIGIDITHLAIGLIRHRLQDAFGQGIAESYKVIGEPTDLAGARQLARDEPFQFQAWATGLVGARLTEVKKGADKGIDGRLFFHDEPGKTKQIILSVKGGDLKADDVRALLGVIERERAHIGVLIALNEPTRGMRSDAASAGFYKGPGVGEGKQYPRLQILTVADLLAGQRIKYPSVGYRNVTFKKAPRAKGKATEQLPLAAEDPADYDPDSN